MLSALELLLLGSEPPLRFLGNFLKRTACLSAHRGCDSAFYQRRRAEPNRTSQPNSSSSSAVSCAENGAAQVHQDQHAFGAVQLLQHFGDMNGVGSQLVMVSPTPAATATGKSGAVICRTSSRTASASFLLCETRTKPTMRASPLL